MSITGRVTEPPHALGNSTHNRAFRVAELGTVTLGPGAQQIRLRFTHPDYASVDWIQLDPVDTAAPPAGGSSTGRSLPGSSSALP